jgi:hypothetical protein
MLVEPMAHVLVVVPILNDLSGVHLFISRRNQSMGVGIEAAY